MDSAVEVDDEELGIPDPIDNNDQVASVPSQDQMKS